MESRPTHLDAQLDAVLVGGREPVRVVLAEPDPAWPGRFAREHARLAAALGAHRHRIEHIGSTAVPGLAAKPIVDILVELGDPGDEALVPTLAAAGYELRVHEPRHRMFRTPARDVHVHVWPTGSAEGRAYLELRDRLRTDPLARARYEQVKRELAGRPWPDMNYYAEAKGPVIAQILAGPE